MKRETLEKAKNLEKEINRYESVDKYINEYKGVEKSICYYHDGELYSSGYKHLLTLDDEFIEIIHKELAKRINELEDMIENL